MRKNGLRVALALTMAMTMSSFDNNVKPVPADDNSRKEIALTDGERELVGRNNEFAFNLFKTMAEKLEVTEKCSCCGASVTSNKSLVISPLSITCALGMLDNGATGETRDQINQVLGFGDAGADAINAFARKMLFEAPTLDNQTKVTMASNIYVNKGYKLKSAFVKKAKNFYGAQPESRNFADGETAAYINRWAADHTDGMIEEVLSKDEFDPSAVSYLLNAIYFKGAWTEKFDPKNTKNEPFKGGKEVAMMHQEHEFGYMDDDDCQMLTLPYGNGAYRMTLLLPRENKTLGQVLQGLTAETWMARVRTMGKAMVDVKLPRFESKTDESLERVMAQLGVTKAFDRNVAEFPAFCNVPTYISQMKQVARIKLSEEGTEAAAVTVGGVRMLSLAPNEPRRVEFHANRPFLYVISELSSGAVFFIGQYAGD